MVEHIRTVDKKAISCDRDRRIPDFRGVMARHAADGEVPLAVSRVEIEAWILVSQRRDIRHAAGCERLAVVDLHRYRSLALRGGNLLRGDDDLGQGVLAGDGLSYRQPHHCAQSDCDKKGAFPWFACWRSVLHDVPRSILIRIYILY